jgi:hypothetical protein
METGILARNCPVFTNDFQDSNPVKSSFTNMKYGVRVFQSPWARKGANINNSSFSQIDTTAIQIEGDRYTTIYNNDIENTFAPQSINTIGIYLKNTSQFAVQNNRIFAKQYGILVDNSGKTYASTISYRNDPNVITNCREGIHAQQDNSRLDIRCNSFTPDPNPASPYNNNWYVTDTLKHIGSYSPGNPSDKTQAGNDFNTNTRKEIFSLAKKFDYYRHSAPPSVIPVPAGVLTATNIKYTPPPKTASSCIGFLRPITNPDLQSLRDSIQKYREEYETIERNLDRGLTDVLLLLNESVLTPTEALLASLLASTPVSDTVLKAVLKRIPSLSIEQVRRLILANSPVSQEVMDEVERKIIGFPEEVIRAIRDAQVLSTVRTLTAVDRSIEFFTLSYDLMLNRYTVEALTDTSRTMGELIEDSSKTAIAAWSIDTTQEAKKVLVSLYIGNGRFVEAQAKLNEIETPTPEMLAWKEITQMAIDLANAGKTWFDLTAAQISYLWMVESTCRRSLAGTYAQNILRQVEGVDFPVLIDKDSPLRVNPKEETAVSLASKEYYLGNNIPNPFNQGTIIPYYLKEGTSAFIKVYNLSGQLMRTYRLSQGRNRVEMQKGNLSNGVYVYFMEVNGVEVDYKKMIISQ